MPNYFTLFISTQEALYSQAEERDADDYYSNGGTQDPRKTGGFRIKQEQNTRMDVDCGIVPCTNHAAATFYSTSSMSDCYGGSFRHGKLIAPPHAYFAQREMPHRRFRLPHAMRLRCVGLVAPLPSSFRQLVATSFTCTPTTKKRWGSSKCVPPVRHDLPLALMWEKGALFFMIAHAAICQREWYGDMGWRHCRFAPRPQQIFCEEGQGGRHPLAKPHDMRPDEQVSPSGAKLSPFTNALVSRLLENHRRSPSPSSMASLAFPFEERAELVKLLTRLSSSSSTCLQVAPRPQTHSRTHICTHKHTKTNAPYPVAPCHHTNLILSPPHTPLAIAKYSCTGVATKFVAVASY